MDGNDFKVFLAAVVHRQQADWLRFHHTAGNHGLLRKHQDVERIVVAAVRLRNEPVVARIMHGAVQHPADVENAGELIEFVFDF